MKLFLSSFIQLIILITLSKIWAKEIRFIDISKDLDRQIIVDKEKGQYLGHPTTTLLNDGKTVLCVYPKGHGKGAIVYKKSYDGGKSWSERLETPTNWTSSKEVPTLFQVKDQKGKKISEMSLIEAKKIFKDKKSIKGGMLPKLSSVISSLEKGVSYAHIVDGRVPHAVLLEILTTKGVGTLISK